MPFPARHSSVTGGSGFGPSLGGVYGRHACTLPGYKYSDAMAHAQITWNEKLRELFEKARMYGLFSDERRILSGGRVHAEIGTMPSVSRLPATTSGPIETSRSSSRSRHPHRVRSGSLAAMVGYHFFSTMNPRFPSTLTAPVFPPSKSPDSSRRPVANS